MKQKLILSALYSHLSTLLVLCVAILSQLTLTSCKDEELTEEEKQQKQEQENDRQFLLTSEFWQVVGQLSNAEVLPDDWQHATFEPGIGEASDKSSTTRIVPTNEAEAAAESFEHLTGADVTGLDSYEWKRDFGTLTYQRLHDGTGWAAVDVDIKQMPGLKRIVYCTPEQQGLNASVPGVPYYRFGDVIKKKNENDEWEYWVCVRPCFGPEKKGDMHWMCLGNLPDKNIKSYTYKGRTWYWPVSLTTNYEHIKNLSEMTFAILDPTRWADHYQNNPNEYMFHDFSTANIKYHNRYFWQLVQDAWNTPLPGEGDKTVADLLFHRSIETLQTSKQLNYFYGSASGPGTWSWYMKMQAISVLIHTADPTGFQCRDLVKKNVNESCEHTDFDIRWYSDNGYSDQDNFFKKNVYIYPLRYATGKTLLGSQPNYYQSMAGPNGIQDVYVFNEFYEQKRGSGYDTKTFDEHDVDSIRKSRQGVERVESKPMAEVKKEDIGKLLAKNGMIYNNAEDAEKDGTKAVAMIVATKEDKFRFTNYDGTESSADKLKSTSVDSHKMLKNALAISLDYWETDVYCYDGRIGNDVGASGNDEENRHYVSSNGLGQWTAATSYFWQRAIAGCGDDDEVWVFNNMLKRYGYEDGYRRGEEIPEDALLPYKNCTKLLNLLKKHNVEYDIADGTYEINILRDGTNLGSTVYHWTLYLNPGNPSDTYFTLLTSVNSSTFENPVDLNVRGVFRNFYVW